MNENDLLISIGADLSLYNKALQTANTSFNNFAKSFSKKNQPNLEMNLETYLKDMDNAKKEFDQTKKYIEQKAIRLGINISDTEVSQLVTKLEKANDAIVADAEKTADEEKAIRKRLTDELKQMNVATYDSDTIPRLRKQLAVQKQLVKQSLDEQKKSILDNQKAEAERFARRVRLEELIAKTQKRIAKEVSDKQIKEEKAVATIRNKAWALMQQQAVTAGKASPIAGTKAIYRELKKEEEKLTAVVKEETTKRNTISSQAWSLMQRQAVAQGRATSIIQTQTKAVNGLTSATNKLAQAQKKTNWDFAGHRGLIDSTLVVAKYGAISQILYGFQNAIRDTIGEMARFDQAIQDNQAILGKTAKEALSLAQNVGQVGTRFGIQVEEIQKGMITFGRAGVEATDQLKAGTEGLAALSVITGDAMHYGAEAMSSMLAVFPKLKNSMGKLADQMGVVANETRLGLEDFSTISNYALTTAANLGVTSQSYLVLQGAMSKVGTSASSIGTSIARIEKIVTDKSAAQVNFFDRLNISQESFANFLREDSDAALSAFTDRLSQAAKDTDLWREITGGLDIQVRKTLNTLAKIGELDVYDILLEKVKGAKNVTAQADIAAQGLNRRWVSLGNTFKQAIDELTPETAISIEKFLPSPQELMSVLRPLLSGLTTLVSLVDEVAIAFAGWFVITRATSAIKALALAMDTYDIVTKRAVATQTIFNAVTKVFSFQNLILTGLVGLYELWNSKAQEAAEIQDKVAKASRLTADELKKMTEAERSVLLIENLKRQENLQNDINDAIHARNRANAYGTETEKQYAQATFDRLKREKDELKEKYQFIKDINEGIKNEGKNTNDAKDAADKLALSVNEVARKTAEASKEAFQFKNSFIEASTAFRQAIIDFDVATGQMTNMTAEAKKYELSMQSNANTLSLVNTQISELQAIKNKTDAESVTLSNLKIQKIQLENKAIALQTQHQQALHNFNMKAIDDETRERKAALELLSAKTSQGLDPKAYAIEQKRLAKELAKVDLDAIDKKILAAKTVDDQAELELQKKELIAQSEKKIAAEINAINRQREQGANKERAIIGYLLKQAEIKGIIAEIEAISDGRLLSQREQDQIALDIANAQVTTAAQAYAEAEKLATTERGRLALKQAEKKLWEAVLNQIKLTNKESNKFAVEMKKVGKDFADTFLSGDIKGAFKGLFNDIKKTFLKPLSDSFSDFFGNKMKKLLGGFYDSLGEFADNWAKDGFSSAFEVAKGNAIAAITNQGASGDPYTAWARMAAMAATVASLGIAVAGSFSGGGGISEAEREAAKGKVEFTDQSLKNLENVFESAQYPMLEVTNKMYRHIRSMDTNFVAIARSLVSSTGGAGALDLTGASYIPQMDQTLWGIWGETTSQLLGSGLKFTGKFIGQYLDGIDNEIRGYLTEAVTESSWFGLVEDTDIKTSFQNLDSRTKKKFQEVFQSGYTSIVEAAAALGFNQAEIEKQLQAVRLKIGDEYGQVSLEGLTESEIADRLSNMFSGIFSSLVDGVAGLEVLTDRYQKQGEESYETLSRIAVDFEQASFMFDLIGKEFTTGVTLEGEKLIKVIKTVTDTTSNIFTSWFGLVKTEGTGITGTFSNILGGITSAITTTTRTVAEVIAQSTKYAYTAQMQILDIVEAAGGIDQFNDAMASFIGNFYTDAEQVEIAAKALEAQFKTLGVIMPETKDQFRALIETWDTSTEEGAKTYGQLLTLADGFAQMRDAANELNGAIKELDLTPVQNIADAWLSDLSYLTNAQKTAFADSYYDMMRELSATNEDVSLVDAARSAAEQALKTTSTKEEFIPYFERYIDALENEVEDATLLDVVNKLDEVVDAILTSSDDSLKTITDVRIVQ